MLSARSFAVTSVPAREGAKKFEKCRPIKRNPSDKRHGPKDGMYPEMPPPPPEITVVGKESS
eukprot:gene11693-34419_t